MPNFEVEKVEIYNSFKQLLKILLFSAAVTLVLTIFVIIDIVKYSNYVTVNAQVESVYIDYDDDGSITYAVVNYTYNGQYYSKTIEDGVFFSSLSEGDSISLKCNPKNASEIENVTEFKELIFVTIIAAMFTMLIVFLIVKKRKQNKTKSNT